MLDWQTATGRLIVHCDSDWAGDKNTRKSESVGNIRYGQHLLRSWSKDQCNRDMHGGTASHGNGEHAPRVGSASGRHGTAGGRQCGHRNHCARHLDVSYLWLPSAVRGKQVHLKKVQSESNMADLRTKVLEKDKIGRHVKSMGCARFVR